MYLLLLVVMLLSKAVSNSLSGDDESLVGGPIAAATLVAINSLLALREHDCTRPEMKCAFLEADGDITILRNPQ